MGRTNYSYPLDDRGDVRLSTTFTTHRGRVQTFTVQLLTYYQGKWHPVIRYDNHHGFPHSDRLHINPNRPQDKRPLDMDSDEALTFAIDDVTIHWKPYVDQFLAGNYL